MSVEERIFDLLDELEDASGRARGFINSAAIRWDLNRRMPGCYNGPIGRVGCWVYSDLIGEELFDRTIFQTSKSKTGTQIAYEIGFSVGSVRKALTLLKDYQFISYRRSEGKIWIGPILNLKSLFENAEYRLKPQNRVIMSNEERSFCRKLLELSDGPSTPSS